MIDERAFRAYDIRGLYPSQINEETAYLLGRAYATHIKPEKVVVGRDARSQSLILEKEVIRGLVDQGVDVIQIGQIPTDLLFFSVGNYGFDGGIAVSASHNPSGYAGFKLVKAGAEPITKASGMEEIQKLMIENNFTRSDVQGKITEKNVFDDYCHYVRSFIGLSGLKPCKVVFNTLGGATGPVAEQVFSTLPVTPIWLEKEPDPDFKNGDPNPLLPERRLTTSNEIISSGADFGVSWDGDGDRVFFFDDKGEFVPAPILSALLIGYLSQSHENLKIVADLRVVFPIRYVCEQHHIDLSLQPAGRAVLQTQLQKQNAYMATELSGHYFFRDFWYSDNGIIPVLMIMDILSRSGKKLSELLEPRRRQFFIADEMKFEISDLAIVYDTLRSTYATGLANTEDGLTIEFPDWRFNLRPSNTESVVRLNVEARTQEVLEGEKAKLINLIKK